MIKIYNLSFPVIYQYTRIITTVTKTGKFLTNTKQFLHCPVLGQEMQWLCEGGGRVGDRVALAGAYPLLLQLTQVQPIHVEDDVEDFPRLSTVSQGVIQVFL